MNIETPSQDCPKCGRFVQDRPNQGLHCQCGWKKLRGASGGVLLPDRGTEAQRFPEDKDPKELHRRIRERLFAHHGGPPMKIINGGYGIDAGDRITWHRKVWTVTRTERWPTNHGHTIDLEAADGTRQRITVPWTFSGYHYDPNERVEVLTSAHYPACGHCGQPWPCREVDEGFRAKRAVDALLTSIEHEAEYPVECRADPPCGKRFKTERGAAQHVRRSRRHQAAVTDVDG